MADYSDQPNDKDSLQEFNNWLKNNWVEGSCVGQDYETVNAQFISYADLEDYLTADRVRALLRDLYSHDVYSEDVLRRIDQQNLQKHYLRVFAILLYIGSGRLIRIFLQHDQLNDMKIPFEEQARPTTFPREGGVDRNIYAMFCQHQFLFVAPLLEYRKACNWEPKRIHPFKRIRPLGEGGSAVTHQIEVHERYNTLHAGRGTLEADDDPFKHTFVLKTFKTRRANEYYTKELEAFLRLGPGRRRDNNLVVFYGSFSQGGTFNLILEYADRGTLEDFFHVEPQPRNGTEVFQFWSAFLKLINAVGAIHAIVGPELDSTQHKYQGYHQDIKPENILVSSRISGSSYKYTFKLADLGSSHFRPTSSSGSPQGSEADSRGTRTYGAPECYRCDADIEQWRIRVTPKVDIWSLGCLYSEGATWAVSGWNGVDVYRTERKTATRGHVLDVGCFHNGDVVLPMIEVHHETLVDERKRTDTTTAPILTMVGCMLYPEELRLTARQSYQMAQDIVKKEELHHGLEKQKTRLDTTDSGRSKKRTMSSNQENGPFDIPSSHYHSHHQRIGRQETVPAQDTAPLPWTRQEELPQRPFSLSPEELPSSTKYSASRPHVSPELQQSPGVPREASLTSPEGSHNSGKFVPGSHEYGPLVRTPTVKSQAETDRHTPKWDRPSRHQPTASPYFPATNSRKTTMHSPPISNEDGHQGYSTSPIQDNDQEPAVIFEGSDESLPGTLQERPGSDSSFHPVRLPHRSRVTSWKSNNHLETSPLPRSADSYRAQTNGPALSKWSVPEATDWVKLRHTQRKLRPEEKEPLPNQHERYQQLDGRDLIFLIDDSYSMAEHWGRMLTILDILTYVGKVSDEDGVELRFCLSPKKLVSSRSSELVDVAARGRPQHGTHGTADVGARLSEFLNEYCSGLASNVKSRWWSHKKRVNPKGCVVYVLTDGIWQPRSEAVTGIRRALALLERLGKSETFLGVQFVQFGDNVEGTKRLERYDQNRKGEIAIRDIIDNEKVDGGDVWKMLLGSINKSFDNDPQDEDSLSSSVPGSSP